MGTYDTKWYNYKPLPEAERAARLHPVSLADVMGFGDILYAVSSINRTLYRKTQ